MFMIHPNDAERKAFFGFGLPTIFSAERTKKTLSIFGSVFFVYSGERPDEGVCA